MALVAPTPIPAQPPAPQPTDSRVDFSNKAFAWVGSMEPTRVASNLLATQTFQNAQYAEAQADRAQSISSAFDTTVANATTTINGIVSTANTTITAKVTQAQDAATLAQSTANFKGNWSALAGALNMPASVRHASRYWTLTSNVVNVAAETPGVSSAWSPLDTGQVVQTLTANATGQSGITYALATTGITLTMPATPNAGDYIEFSNVSGGDVYINWSGKTVKGQTPDSPMKVPSLGAAGVRFTGSTWV